MPIISDTGTTKQKLRLDLDGYSYIVRTKTDQLPKKQEKHSNCTKRLSPHPQLGTPPLILTYKRRFLFSHQDIPPQIDLIAHHIPLSFFVFPRLREQGLET
jgi:hypothetical protein